MCCEKEGHDQFLVTRFKSIWILHFDLYFFILKRLPLHIKKMENPVVANSSMYHTVTLFTVRDSKYYLTCWDYTFTIMSIYRDKAL